MKKAIVALAAVGTVVGLLVAARWVSRELREHSKQMMEHCKQMMASCNGSSEVPSEREVNEIKKQRAAAPTA
jgi:uncharacterized protein YneF (UPF0154 family)